MVTRHNSSAIFLVLCILRMQRIGIYGAPEWYQNPTTFDTAENKRDTSAVSSEKMDHLNSNIPLLSFSSEATRCPINSKIRIPLCCDPGEAREYGYCAKNHSEVPRNITVIDDDGVEEVIPEENSDCSTYDPCAYRWMTSSIIENFTIYKNGTIHSPDFNGGMSSDFQYYCLMRAPHSSEHVAKMCRIWIERGYYEIGCVVASIIIILLMLIVFTALPELRNFHGSLFRCYMANYIGLYTFALAVQLTAALRIHQFWFSFVETATRYLCVSCALWLNVMSYNIWRSFRYIRTIPCDFKNRERRKFIRYAIYAWGSPMVLLVISLCLLKYVPYLHADVIDQLFIQWVSVAVIMLALGCNVYLHASTALTIRQQKRDVAHITDSMDKHYAVEIQWFKLYLKLFVIMGGHLAMWLVWLLWPTRFMIRLLSTVELLQSILLFVIFILKDNIIQLLRQRFHTSWIRSRRSQDTTETGSRSAETQ